MYTKKSLHGIISVHFHQRRSEFGQKLTKFDPKSWNQKESVQESIQESKRIGFSSQHQPPEPKNPREEVIDRGKFLWLQRFTHALTSNA